MFDHPAAFSHTQTPDAGQLDVVSGALLPIVRHFLNAYLNPESFGWRHAYGASAEVWGEARGLAIAHGVQQFLSAVLKARPVPVAYMDPLDIDQRETLTHDEVDLLGLIAAMRADKTAQARETIMRLTGGQVPTQLVESGLKLAAQLDRNPRQRNAAPLKLVHSSRS
ncbi:hypothetical protein [Loktanella sp. S4079]|uniref:hypothetical protein n=1 Tax=Loktanella sp. S4079 TaxID=579483 RepID=UPI0005FA2B96|nr:hypothetical protein [Loktanella sp. S4079]